MVKNAESIMDAYRAHLRGKATFERAQKQAEEKATFKKDDNRPEYKKDQTQFL